MNAANSAKLIRFAWLILVLVTIGCAPPSPLNSKQITPEDKLKRLQATVQNLEEDSAWLFFDFADCPADVMSSYKRIAEYFSDGCAANPEICLNKCQGDDGNACYALALLLQEQKSIEQKYFEALFLRSCKLGIVSGCTNRAAGVLNLDSDDAAISKCAAKTFEKTCSADDPWGCAMYGLVLTQGVGCDQNFDKALEVLPKGCKFGSSDPACQESKRLQEDILKFRQNGANKVDNQ